jgi:tRNA1(Val) A37 N6-methylase TrmN6
MPNDEQEQDRLDLQHHLFRLTAGGALYIAPVPRDVQSCLDVGCGTGIVRLFVLPSNSRSARLEFRVGERETHIYGTNDD